MTDLTSRSPKNLSRASGLALMTALLGLILGCAAIGLGFAEDATAFWGFGLASLLQVPLALRVRKRIQDGLGNRGLDQERRTVRTVSHLLRLTALGLALASAAAIFNHQAPEFTLQTLGFAALAIALLTCLWYGKQSLAQVHPTLTLDIARTRTLLELAGILLVGSILGRWFPMADALTGFILALRLFFEGQTLARGTALPSACGGCGSGCGCG